MAGGKRKCCLVKQPQAEQVRKGFQTAWRETETPPTSFHVSLSNPSPNLQSITNSMRQILPQVLRQTSEICLRLRGKFVYTISIPQLPRALHVSPNPKLHSTPSILQLVLNPSARSATPTAKTLFPSGNPLCSLPLGNRPLWRD